MRLKDASSVTMASSDSRMTTEMLGVAVFADTLTVDAVVGFVADAVVVLRLQFRLPTYAPIRPAHVAMATLPFRLFFHLRVAANSFFPL